MNPEIVADEYSVFIFWVIIGFTLGALFEWWPTDDDHLHNWEWAVLDDEATIGTDDTDLGYRALCTSVFEEAAQRARQGPASVCPHAGSSGTIEDNEQ